MRAWDQVRELTLKSIAPTLVYEEANLIKRSIRDLYTKDIDEVLVDGDEGYKTAKEFMRMLMPSHAKKVQPYKDPEIPLFHRYQVEAQLDAMHSPQVQLKSGGYIVINPTEALVSIDVNSGRATRERNVEETAYKTNLEAADEIARQLRLRDLAGLIVVDFIDMAEHRNQHNVERRIKDAMRSDRARIQIGRISAFGLLELSRQRLRPSLIETSTQPCPHCHGTGLIRSTESAALHVLRAIEEEGIRRRSIELRISVPTSIALYVLNQKRAMLRAIESRYGFSVRVDADDSLIPPDYTLERVEGRPVGEAPRPEAAAAEPESTEVEEDVLSEDETEAQDDTAAVPRQREGNEERGGRRRGRRGRRGRRPESGGDGAASGQPSAGALAAAPADVASDAGEFQGENHEGGSTESAAQVQGTPGKRRRRGRRGGRRRGRNRDGDSPHPTEPQAQAASPGDTTSSEPRVNGDTRAGDEEAVPAPEHAVEPHREEINGYTDADAPAAAASQTGNGGVEPVQESPAPPEAAVEPEVAAKTDAPKRKGWWNRFGG
jgi:ribonuclease E